jgi:hypothetical protein
MAGRGGEPAVLFEFHTIGTSVKAVAIDEATGLEVSIIGPASAARFDMQKLALAKLRRALAKRAETSGP